MKLTLPFPPSVNGLYATNFKTKRRFKSKKYVEWGHAAIWDITRLGMTKGKVKVLYEFGRPDKRRRDVANYEKAVSDILVAGGLIEDDSMIEEITLRWADVEGVEITIEAIE
jgi:crossover junction endodeoxyribonuclease RusA